MEKFQLADMNASRAACDAVLPLADRTGGERSAEVESDTLERIESESVAAVSTSLAVGVSPRCCPRSDEDEAGAPERRPVEGASGERGTPLVRTGDGGCLGKFQSDIMNAVRAALMSVVSACSTDAALLLSAESDPLDEARPPTGPVRRPWPTAEAYARGESLSIELGRPPLPPACIPPKPPLPPRLLRLVSVETVEEAA